MERIHDTRTQLELLVKLARRHLREAEELRLSESEVLFRDIVGEIERILGRREKPEEDVWLDVGERMHAAARKKLREFCARR